MADMKVNLSVRNPFPHPVTARASLHVGSILKNADSDSRTIQLAAGQSGHLQLAVTVHQRDQPRLPARLGFHMDAEGKPIGGGTETLWISVLNAVELTAAPLDKGIRIILHSPSGTPFAGSIHADNRLRPFALSATSPTATVDVSENGDETVALMDKAERLVGILAVQAYQRLVVSSFKAALDGDAKIPATARIEPATPPEANSPGTKVFALDYDCAEGWRFVRCEAVLAKPIVFEGRPLALGIWVYGDNSGNALRARVRDASGQTFQPNGPNLDWKGWRWVEFDLEDLSKAGHWGGANDGVLKGNLTLDTLLLVDMNRRKTSGRIYFTGPAAVYKPTSR
jgi:hypothetical protein